MTGDGSDNLAPDATDEPTEPTVTRAARARPALRFSIVLLLSIALHAALAATLWDEPLGFVGARNQSEPPTVMRVRRAQYDYFVSDAPSQTTGEAPTSDSPSASDLSRAMLKGELTTAPSPAASEDAAPRRINEKRPINQPDNNADETNAAAAPQLFESLVERAPEQLSIEGAGNNGSNGPGNGSNGDDGAPGGSGNDGAGNGAAEARQLLAEAGATPTSNPEPPEAAPAQIQDRAAQDERLMEPTPAGDDFDLASESLVNTQELDIPTHLDNDFNYYLSRFDPPGEPGYFRVDIAARQSLNKLPAMPKDVIFLIDTSDSIASEWVDQVVAGVQRALPTLNRGDRFNIVFFNEQPRFFSTDGPRPANAKTLNEARTFLKSTQSEGYTDVNAALRQLLVRRVDPDRVYEIILLSDGKPTRGVMDTRELINVITRNNQRVASIYCIGVGADQNRELLDFLAYRNKGFSRFITNRAETPKRIAAMMDRLRYPLIKNVQLNATGIDENRVFPRQLPNIHAGQTLSVFGRYQQRRSFTMRLTGRAAGKDVDFTFTRDLSLASPDDRSIARGWAFWKLHHLYSEIIKRGKSDTLQKQLDQLQKKYDIDTVY